MPKKESKVRRKSSDLVRKKKRKRHTRGGTSPKKKVFGGGEKHYTPDFRSPPPIFLPCLLSFLPFLFLIVRMATLRDCPECLEAGCKKYSFSGRDFIVHLEQHEAAKTNVTIAFEQESEEDLSLQVGLRTLTKEELKKWIRRPRGDNKITSNHKVSMRCSESQFLRIFGGLPLLLKNQRYHATVGGLAGQKLLEESLGVDWDTYELEDGTTYFVATQVAE